MKIYQEEISFKDISIILEDKEEANAFIELINLFSKKMLDDGKISREAYNLTIKLSDAFTDCALEIPLNAEEKENAIGNF